MDGQNTNGTKDAMNTSPIDSPDDTLWQDILDDILASLDDVDRTPKTPCGPLLGNADLLVLPEGASVVCSRCTTSFEPQRIQLAPHTVAYGCTAVAHTSGRISVAYGSPTYEWHTLTSTNLERTPHGIICDGCITVLIASGVVVGDV